MLSHRIHPAFTPFQISTVGVTITQTLLSVKQSIYLGGGISIVNIHILYDLKWDI